LGWGTAKGRSPVGPRPGGLLLVVFFVFVVDDLLNILTH